MSGSEPKAILFYFDGCELDESRRALLAALDRLDASRYPRRALLPSDSGALAAELRARAVEVDVLALPPRYRRGAGARAWLAAMHGLWAYYRKLFRYFGMYDFGLVHTDGYRAHWLSIGFKVRFNVPLLWQLWSIVPAGAIQRRFRLIAALFSDHIVASSLFVAHQLGRSPRWRDSLSTLYRGYEPRTRPPRAAGGAPVLALVLEPGEDAGVKTFARTLELVRKEAAEYRGVVLAADAGSAARAAEVLRDMRLEDCVRVERVAEAAERDLAAELQRFGATVLLNAAVVPRAFHADVAEAMGVGVPVVASRQGVLSELILSETNGLLVTTGDAAEAARAVLRLTRDEVLRARLVKHAHQEFEARFNIGRYVEKLAAIYESLLGEQKRERAEESATPETELKRAA